MFVRSSNVVMAGGCIRCQRIAWPWGGLVVATVELAVILLAAKARRRSSSGSAAFGRRSSSSSEVQRHDAGAGGGNAGVAGGLLDGGCHRCHRRAGQSGARSGEVKLHFSGKEHLPRGTRRRAEGGHMCRWSSARSLVWFFPHVARCRRSSARIRSKPFQFENYFKFETNDSRDSVPSLVKIPAAMSGQLRFSWSVRRAFGIGR